MQNKANFRKSQMNVTSSITKYYENISDWTLGENKPNSKPIKANLRFTTENTEHAEKKDISVSYCSIERYALYHIFPCSLRTRRLMKNKAKTKPIKANLHFTAENTEYAEKKDICVSYCSLKKYALYHIFPCSLRTRRLMKNKPNSKPILERMNVNFCAKGYYESKPAIRVAGKPTFAVTKGPAVCVDRIDRNIFIYKIRQLNSWRTCDGLYMS